MPYVMHKILPKKRHGRGTSFLRCLPISFSPWPLLCRSRGTNEASINKKPGSIKNLNNSIIYYAKLIFKCAGARETASAVSPPYLAAVRNITMYINTCNISQRAWEYSVFIILTLYIPRNILSMPGTGNCCTVSLFRAVSGSRTEFFI